MTAPVYVYPAIGDVRAYVNGLAASAARRGPQGAMLLGMAWMLAALDTSVGDLVLALDANVATGGVLDVLGARVGEPRGGMGDREYRRIILGRSLAADAHGTPGGVMATWLALTGAPASRANMRRSMPSGALPPHLYLDGEVDSAPTQEYLLRAGAVLRDALADGITATATAYPSGTVLWSGDPGWYDGSWGYGVLP